MTRKLSFCTLAILAAIFTLSSCKNSVTRLEKVPAPTWYDYEDYFTEKTGVFADLPIHSDDIVMLGDEIIDFGEWSNFFQDTCFINRGIMFEGSPHTLYRIDGIANSTPSKIFVSTGLQDIKRAGDSAANTVADTVIANVKEIFRRAHAISPETELYYISILPDRQVSDAGVLAMKKVNKHISDEAAEGGIFTFVDITNMADGSGRMDEQYTYDGRSLNGLGYEKVTEKIVQQLPTSMKAQNKAADRNYPEISPAHHNRVSLFNSLPQNTHSVMFLGNSITRRGPWQELLPFLYITNRGVGGDVLKGMYNRIDDVAADDPAAIFLMGGINDLTNPSKSVDEIWKDYDRLLAKLHKELPNTFLFVQSTLPVTAERDKDNTINPRVMELNKYLQAAAEKYNYRYIDVAEALSDGNGYLKAEFSIDGLHLDADAYFTWATVLMDKAYLLLLKERQLYLDASELLEISKSIK